LTGRAFAVAVWVCSGVGAFVWSMHRTRGSMGEDVDRRVAALSPAERFAFACTLFLYVSLLGLVALALELEHRYRVRRLVRFLAGDDFDRDFDEDDD
jgi:hypothetical protein